MAERPAHTAGHAMVLSAAAIAFAAHGSIEPAKGGGAQRAVPGAKSAAARQAAPSAAAAPGARAASAKAPSSRLPAKAANGRRAVPNEQLGLGCSNAE